MRNQLRFVSLLSLLSAAILCTSFSYAADKIKGSFVGVTYNGLHAKENPTSSEVNKDLSIIANSFDYIRTYYPQYVGGVVPLLELAKNNNVKMLVGLHFHYQHPEWTEGDYNNILRPKLQANGDGAIIGVLVGNENLGEVGNIKTYIRKVKADAPTVPVSTAQTNGDWLGNVDSELVSLVDFIAANIYPSWCWYNSTSGFMPAAQCNDLSTPVTPEKAFNSFKQQFDDLQGKYPTKQIVVTETGYPTNYGLGRAADTDSPASKLNECKYLQKVSQWAKDNNQIVFIYEMFDSQVSVNTKSNFNYHFGLWGGTTDQKQKFTIPSFKGNIPIVSCSE